MKERQHDARSPSRLSQDEPKLFYRQNHPGGPLLNKTFYISNYLAVKKVKVIKSNSTIHLFFLLLRILRTTKSFHLITFELHDLYYFFRTFC